MGLKKQIYEAGSGNEGETDKLWDKQSGKLVEGMSDKVRAMEQAVPWPVRRWLNLTLEIRRLCVLEAVE